jgi:hypothetical protein
MEGQVLSAPQLLRMVLFPVGVVAERAQEHLVLGVLEGVKLLFGSQRFCY